MPFPVCQKVIPKDVAALRAGCPFPLCAMRVPPSFFGLRMWDATPEEATRHDTTRHDAQGLGERTSFRRSSNAACTVTSDGNRRLVFPASLCTASRQPSLVRCIRHPDAVARSYFHVPSSPRAQRTQSSQRTRFAALVCGLHKNIAVRRATCVFSPCRARTPGLRRH